MADSAKKAPSAGSEQSGPGTSQPVLGAQPEPLSPTIATSNTDDFMICRELLPPTPADYGLPTTCLRCFNVYGPRQDSDSQCATVIPRFIKSWLDNRPADIMHSLAGISRAKRLGHKPRHSLEEGLRETIAAMHGLCRCSHPDR